NNPGLNDIDHSRLAAAVQYEFALGTIAALTGAENLEEISLGDGFDYKPVTESIFFDALGFDVARTEFVDSEMRSKEIRFKSAVGRPVAWTLGVFYAETERFVSRGDLVDFGLGIHPGLREPSNNVSSPQF